MNIRAIKRLACLMGMAAAVLAACSGGSDPAMGDNSSPPPPPPPPPPPVEETIVGAVYAGTNNPDPKGNFVVGFSRSSSGKLAPMKAYETGGTGRAGPSQPRLNSLISEDSILAVEGRFLLVVNAGSNDVTCFRIDADFGLTRTDIEPSGGTAPISLAYRNGIVYVANADEDGVFNGPPDQSGNITAMRLDLSSGDLTAIPDSSVSLHGRPADLEITPDGYYLLVSSLNAGSALLPGPTAAEISSFLIQSDGRLATTPSGTGQSTLVGNAAGRNLPNAIGIEAFALGDRQFVMAAEARTASSAGLPPASLASLQTGSVSSWEINADGTLLPLVQDYQLGPSIDSGPLQTGFLAFAPGDSTVFWVSSTAGSTISSYGLFDRTSAPSLDKIGMIGGGGVQAGGTPVDIESPTPFANADGFVDIAISPDSYWLYQLVGLKGRIEVYAIDAFFTYGIDHRQTITSDLLPMDNLQGLVAVGEHVP